MPNENTEYINHEDELPDHIEGDLEIDEEGNLVDKKSGGIFEEEAE